jgi:hypothetical protein
MALCKSLLDEKIFSLDVAQFPQATPENIKIRTPGLTTNFQPAHARNPTRSLHPRSRCGEQAYDNGNNPEPDYLIRVSISVLSVARER